MRASRARLLSVASVWILAGCAASAGAQPFPERSLPPELKTWTGWVLDEAPDHVCIARGEEEEAVCLWPGRLRLDLGESGGTFRQQAYADRELYLRLPGSAQVWPQGVTLDGRPVAVVAQEEAPAVRLLAGTHVVAGAFEWKQMPDSLAVPQMTALVDLSVRGLRIAIPPREEDGLLWLRRGSERGPAAAESVRIQVFRRLSDGIPLFVDTRLVLDVSGKAREVTLRGAALAHSAPVATEGELPVQLDADGSLRVQVRTGKFNVSLLSRLEGNPQEVVIPRGREPWPPSETWVFAANETLRHAQLSGGAPIDPSRADLPSDWRSLPAFVLAAGGRLAIKELERGEAVAAPDRIELAREMWLDLSGQGFTVRDQFAGTLSRTWRLDESAPGLLGRVTVGGREELVTATAEGQAGGFEARARQLQAAAESRLPRSGFLPAALPAVGWAADVEKLGVTLHLPPGWSLLFSTGVDRTSGSWVSSWTLLGFFLVLLIAFGAGRLFGWRTGVVALAGVGLAYHEAGAPLASWLSLLAASAVLGAQPPGRWGKLVQAWWWASALVLAVVLALFARDQVRAALYPQVESGLGIEEQGAPDSPGASFALVVPQAAPPPSRELNVPVQVGKEARFTETQSRDADLRLKGYAYDRNDGATKVRVDAQQSLSNLAQDPHSALQTGPGVPRWSWRSVALSWSGPVSRTHRMRLFVLSPKANLYLTAFRLTLLLLLAARIVRPHLSAVGGWLSGPSRAATLPAIIACAVGLGLIAGPRPAHAADAPEQAQPTPSGRAFSGPSAELLEDLKARLTRGAPCAPDCVSTSRLTLTIAGERLSLRAEVHADAKVAWVVPGPVASWLPSEIQIDGRPAVALVRLDDGFLHVRLEPGVHDVFASGPLPPHDSLTLQLKDRPRRALAEASGWDVAGIREDGPPDESIQLSRRLPGGKRTSVSGGHYSSWLEVTRTIEIGVSWRVETNVRRVSPAGVPVAARIPLLPGEALSEGDWPVEKGEVALSLSRDQTEAAWASTLVPAPKLTLTAPEGQAWSEVWRVRCGVVWQCRFAGIAPVSHEDAGTYEPQFRPWPGEKLALHFERPTGVAGPTVTIDKAERIVAPGTRLETDDLMLWTRASREESLALTLPDGADVQEVKVGGAARPIRPAGSRLAVTVPAGSSTVQIRWHRPRGLGLRYVTPPVGLSLPAANVGTTVHLPEGRFVLLARGPGWGPAVLFWSYLVIVLAAAVVIGRLPHSPLTTGQWLLLGLGLTQTSPLAALVIAGLPFALAFRGRRPAARGVAFNLIQIGLVLWTLIALGCLFSAVETGLLLRPEMQVAGSGSTDTALHWYADRIDAALPQVSVVSLPLWTYRVSMLVWALWLAAGLVRAAAWGFRAFTQGGAWRGWRVRSKAEQASKGAILS